MVPSPSVPTRRSTRTAARNAAALIAEELAPQRSSTRLASLLSVSESAISNGNGGMPVVTTTVVTTTTTTRRRNPNPNTLIAASSGSMENLSPEKRRPSRSAARGRTMESPIVLLDDDSIDEMDLKPAAVAAIAVAAITAVVVEKPPEDFICPICLDAPDCMTEVATINGCTHRFCFDCVDQWAGTENRCPCCKARFQTIDRVIALPPSPNALGQGRRGKRKRDRDSSSPRSVRVNSRNVEDRNQQSMTAFTVDAAMVHQILSTFIGGAGRGGAGPLGGNITFDTSEDGRPQIRMVHPGNGMVGVLEMIVSEASGAGARGGGGLARASSSAIGSNNPSISRIRSPRSGQPPMAAAGATSAGGPSAAANRSAFARLFASLRSPGNSPGVSANARATTNRGTPSGSPPMGMTIRFTRPAASTTGRLTDVERQSRPPSRSSTLRSAFVAVGGNGEEDSEPIVID